MKREILNQKLKKLSSTVLRPVPGVLSTSQRTENLGGVTLLKNANQKKGRGE